MGEAFYRAWPETRNRLDALSRALGDDLAALCFDGDEVELRQTWNTQPALFGLGLAVYEGLLTRHGITPDYVAGHSLGHFTALAAARTLDPAEGVALVRERGELLAAAARETGPGTMVAVLLADPKEVAAACADRENVSVGLYNGPRQTVISGTSNAVAAATETIEERTRVRFRELDVAAAFHSPVMEPATEDVDQALASVELAPATIPVVSDVSGRVYTDPEIARRDLSEQVTAPVDWHGVVTRLREADVDRYVVIPPAGALAALIERVHPEAEIIALETPEDAASLDEPTNDATDDPQDMATSDSSAASAAALDSTSEVSRDE